jgi:hypothetical protein
MVGFFGKGDYHWIEYPSHQVARSLGSQVCIFTKILQGSAGLPFD